MSDSEQTAREIAEHAAYRGFAVDVLAERIAEALRSFGDARYREGLEDAAKSAEAWAKPSLEGVDITAGIPAEIYVQIGRGEYDGEEGIEAYTLAGDVANSARDEIAAAIRRLSKEAQP